MPMMGTHSAFSLLGHGWQTGALLQTSIARLARSAQRFQERAGVVCSEQVERRSENRARSEEHRSWVTVRHSHSTQELNANGSLAVRENQTEKSSLVSKRWHEQIREHRDIKSPSFCDQQVRDGMNAKKTPASVRWRSEQGERRRDDRVQSPMLAARWSKQTREGTGAKSPPPLASVRRNEQGAARWVEHSERRGEYHDGRTDRRGVSSVTKSPSRSRR